MTLRLLDQLGRDFGDGIYTDTRKLQKLSMNQSNLQIGWPAHEQCRLHVGLTSSITNIRNIILLIKNIGNVIKTPEVNKGLLYA